MKRSNTLSVYELLIPIVLMMSLLSCSHRAARPTNLVQSTKEYQKTIDTMKQATSNLKSTLDGNKPVLKTPNNK